jgi:uncharacterized membrane protein YagU involved in acid resistance
MRNPWLKGAVSGVVATAAMTGAQIAGLKLLPARNPEPERGDAKDRWTPEHVFEETMVKADLDPHVDEEMIRPLAIASHFGYGAAWGSLYGAWRREDADVPTGIVFGLAVWALSYGGLLPSFGIVRDPEDEDLNRHLRLILAHLVYGTVLAAAIQQASANGAEPEWQVEGGA